MEDCADNVVSSLGPLIAVTATVSVEICLETEDLVKLRLLGVVEVLYLDAFK